MTTVQSDDRYLSLVRRAVRRANQFKQPVVITRNGGIALQSAYAYRRKPHLILETIHPVKGIEHE